MDTTNTPMGRVVPPGVLVAEAFADAPREAIPADEYALVADCAPKRRNEFVTGRACAHRALKSAGAADAPILADPRGCPLWPPGFVGSITHCAGYRCAAVARSRDMALLGVDAERPVAFDAELLEAVTTARERGILGALEASSPATPWPCILFSAKESLYKAVYPRLRAFLGFGDAEVRIAPDGTWQATLLGPPAATRTLPERSLTGRWAVADGLVLTALAVPEADPAARGAKNGK